MTSLPNPNDYEAHVTPVVRRVGLNISPDGQVVRQDIGDEWTPIHYMSVQCGPFEAGRVVHIQYKLALATPFDNEPGDWHFRLLADDTSVPDPAFRADETLIPYTGGMAFKPVGIMSMVVPELGWLTLTLQSRLDTGRGGRLSVSEDSKARSYLIAFDLGGV